MDLYNRVTQKKGKKENNYTEGSSINGNKMASSTLHEADANGEDFSSLINEQKMINTVTDQKYSELAQSVNALANTAHSAYTTMQRNVDSLKSDQAKANLSSMDRDYQNKQQLNELKHQGERAMEKIRSLDSRASTFSTDFDHFKDGTVSRIAAIQRDIVNIKSDQDQFNEKAIEKHDILATQLRNTEKMNQWMMLSLNDFGSHINALRTDLNTFKTEIGGQLSAVQVSLTDFIEQQGEINHNFREQNDNLEKRVGTVQEEFDHKHDKLEVEIKDEMKTFDYKSGMLILKLLYFFAFIVVVGAVGFHFSKTKK